FSICAALFERHAAGRVCGTSIGEDTSASCCEEGAKARQCHQLAMREEMLELGQSVPVDVDSPWPVKQLPRWHVLGLRNRSRIRLVVRRCEIYPRPIPFGGDCHELRPEADLPTCFTNVLESDRGATRYADCTCSTY